MIIDLQRRIAEVGRIRIGQQVEASNGKKRPAKLTTFRLTSPDRARIQQAATLYGGQPSEWDAPSGRQWEVVTASDALNVIVPPGDMAFSQWYELWAAGGCQRRCDGQFDSVGDQPCICDPDKRECGIHTRLSVMIRDLPGLGLWRVDTQGYYAALELQGAVGVVQMAAGAGRMLPARLRLEQRMIKRANQGVKRFAVPVLDIEVSPAQLLSGGQLPALSDPGVVAIEPPRVIDNSAPLTPVPESVPERPSAPIAEQVAQVREKPKRSNAAQPVPRTGLAPRTAAQAAVQNAPASPDDTTAAAEPAPVHTDDPPITSPQLQKLSILRKREGYADDEKGRADWFAWIDLQINRVVTTNKDLTKAEASVLIDVLENPGEATELPLS
jgi:hypothetical protein